MTKDISLVHVENKIITRTRQTKALTRSYLKNTTNLIGYDTCAFPRVRTFPYTISIISLRYFKIISQSIPCITRLKLL